MIKPTNIQNIEMLIITPAIISVPTNAFVNKLTPVSNNHFPNLIVAPTVPMMFFNIQITNFTVVANAIIINIISPVPFFLENNSSCIIGYVKFAKKI